MELTPVNPIIAGVEITTDNEGRFNLNAIHRASGGNAKDAPAQWFRTLAAKDLIAELTDMQICTEPVSAIKGGLDQGTFAHELLAVSYAGWISPAFQLKVNQVFIDYRSGKLKPFDPHAILSDPAAMRGLLLTYTEKVIALEEKVADLTPKAEALDRLADAEGLANMTTAAKLIGIPPRKFIQHLHAHHWIFRNRGSGKWEGHADRVRQGLLDHKFHTVIDSEGFERAVPQVYVTAKGVARLSVLLGGVQ